MIEEKNGEGGIPPGWVIAGISVAAVATVAAGVLSHQWVIVTIGLVLILLLVVAFFVIRALDKSGRSKSFSKSIHGFFNQVREGRDPQQLANLDELQRKFDALVKDFEAAKTNLYDLPWYLIIGPSGSGKSWALRGCKKIKPLIEEDYSGPSAKKDGQRRGTLLMDWWCSDEAIILDTAGGTVFQEEFREDEAIDSPEWQLLLKLLKETRPACPINGVFVTIPAELLLLEEKDLPEKAITLEQYAESLRHQLKDNLQGKLGVRFPVYFLVTKGDLIPGFREFADDTEAASPAQHATRARDQILGWSNPEEVGKPQAARGNRNAGQDGFNPSLIGQYIQELTAAIRRGRMTLLVKYAGKGISPEGVDTIQHRACDLFGFPSALDELAPRLQGFMETVFSVPNNSRSASGKNALPPFVRGIYFTSAMREGEVLDRVRAAMAGTTLAKLVLPGAKDRNTTKSFFLADLFLQKALLEGGLVIPNVEAREFFKGRRRAVIWSLIGAASLLLVLVVAGGLGYTSVVKKTVEPWEAVGSAANQSRFWLPIIEKSAGGAYTVNADNIKSHRSLSSSVDSGWAHWLYGDLKNKVRPAQLALFEHGVVLPLAEYAREHLLVSLPDDPATNADQLAKLQVGGILGLLELELATNGLSSSEYSRAAELFVGGEMRFLTASVEPKGVDQVQQLFINTYSRPENRTNWPPAGARDSAKSSSSLEVGITNLVKIYGIQGNQFLTNRDSLINRINGISQCLDKEKRLLDKLTRRVPVEDLAESVENIRKEWGGVLKNAGRDSLQSEIIALSNSVSLFYSTNIGTLRSNFDSVHGFNLGTNESIVLNVQRQLKRLEQESTNQVAQLLSLNEKLGDEFSEKIRTADDRAWRVISKPASGAATPTRAFDARLGVYKTLTGLSSKENRADFLDSKELGVEQVIKTFFDDKSDVSAKLKKSVFPSVGEYPVDTGESEVSSRYLETVRKYVDYLRVEEFTLRCAKRINDEVKKMTGSLDSFETTDTLQFLQERANDAIKLDFLDKKSKEVVPENETLRDPSEELTNLKNAKSTIENARKMLRESLQSRFKSDCEDPIAPFLEDDNGSAKSVNANFATGFKKFIIWGDILQRPQPEERQLSGALKKLVAWDTWKTDFEKTGAVYNQIYVQPASGTRKGALSPQKYRISFDTDPVTKESIRIVRGWNFGNSGWIDGSMLTSKGDSSDGNVREFSALDGVDIQVRDHATDSNKPASILYPDKNLRSPESASILFWINRIANRESPSNGPWKVPLKVGFGREKTEYSVVLIVTQVPTN